jgi:hypothetical protein
MQAVFDDRRFDRRQFGDLVAQGLGINAAQGVAATATGVGLVVEGLGQTFGLNQRTNAPRVPGLAAASATAGSYGGPAFLANESAGGRPRGIAGVPVEAFTQLSVLTFELLDTIKQVHQKGQHFRRRASKNGRIKR